MLDKEILKEELNKVIDKAYNVKEEASLAFDKTTAKLKDYLNDKLDSFLKENNDKIEDLDIKHCVTCIIKNENNEILVLEHMKCKNKFTFPAGTIEPGEDPEETVIREMKEELDIEIDSKNLILVGSNFAYYDRIDGHKIYKEFTYRVLNYSGDIKNMEPVKHPSMKWVKPKEIFMHPELYTYNTWLLTAKGLNN